MVKVACVIAFAVVEAASAVDVPPQQPRKVDSVAVARGWQDFGQVRAFLDSTFFQYGNISLTVGDESGALFEYSSGGMTADVPLNLASGSKWPSATALLGCFHDYNVSLDTKVNEYLDYWAKSPFDERSEVTLRHVLSMTTGMVVDSDCNLVYSDCAERKALGKAAFEAFGKCEFGQSLPTCTRKLYEALPARPLYRPGAAFMYSSLSFQFAAAVAVAASGLPIGEILDRYLLKKAGMEGCSYSHATTNPLLGGGLSCSARSMDKFVHAMLTDGILPRAVREAAETVQVTDVAAYSTTTAYWGPYCLGNWAECMYGQGLGRPFPRQCADAGRHSHPGCGGYYNYVHRTQRYYFNMLPSWTCTAANAWCGAGSEDAGGAGCPALYGWASTLRRDISGFLDDLFATTHHGPFDL